MCLFIRSRPGEAQTALLEASQLLYCKGEAGNKCLLDDILPSPWNALCFQAQESPLSWEMPLKCRRWTSLLRQSGSRREYRDCDVAMYAEQEYRDVLSQK